MVFMAQAQEASIQQGVLYLKLKHETTQRSLKVDNQFQFSKLEGLKRYEPLLKGNSNSRRSASILDGLYKVYLDDQPDIEELCRQLAAYDNIAYAEPVYQEQLLYVPSDPDATNGNQSYLGVIKAFEAWDVTKGDAQVVIGIIDTGVERQHPDIAAKIDLNESDPPNGIDDDDNGYVDDYWGYDFADNDSIPQSDYRSHGNMVAGIAGAHTDDGIGIAGVGFNTMIRPLKTFRSADNSSSGNYEAILYAADNGCDIINLSWGSANSYSQANEDIINYAVLEKNVVVIAAAGNTPAQLDFYPASYENVLSVTATNNNDTKASFATYSYQIDLCAPGNAIYSSASDGEYATDNGTSYSSPMVAGAAALVKTTFPALNAEQIRERIRVTSDDIYSSNSSYQGMLGAGRLNVFRAVTETDLKSVRAMHLAYHNGSLPMAFHGDTIRLTFDLKNFLSSTEHLMIHFSSESQYVRFITDSLEVGVLETIESQALEITTFVLSEDTPPSTEIDIRMDFVDGDYTDFQYFHLSTEEDRITLDNSTISLTVSGKGALGRSEGNGMDFTRNNQVVTSEMGIAFGLSKHQVSDNLPDTSRSNDFMGVYPVKYEPHPEIDYLISSTFRDDSASSPIGITVDQKTMTNSNANFIIQEYRISNHSSENITNLKAGFYANWELTPLTENRAYYSDSLHTMIALNSDSSLFAGIRSYHDHLPVAQAMNLTEGHGNEPNVPDLMIDSLVYTLLDSTQYNESGWSGAGNDISTFLAQDSINIPIGESQKSTFLLAVSNSLEGLQAALDDAEIAYQHFQEVPELLEQIFSCRGVVLTIDPFLGTNYQFYADPYAQILIAEDSTLQTGILNEDTTFYAINVDNDYESDILRIDVKMIDRITNFTMSTDTLLWSTDTTNAVSFIDDSFLPSTWSWDFDNGLRASIQNPTVSFQSTGTYEITLTVTNELGCTDSNTRSLLVVNRPEKPILSDQVICPDQPVTFNASNGDSLALYLNATDEAPYLIGSSITISHIDRDTTFYFTNVQNGYESFKTPIKVALSDLKAEFTYIPDTTSEAFQAYFINSTKESSETKWYVDTQFITDENQLFLNPEKDSYEISLTAMNANGCMDSISQTVVFQASPLPILVFDQPCLGDSLFLAPENGRFFGFYMDEALTQIIRKDTALYLPSVDNAQQIYAIGLDSIYPSEPVMISISPEDLPFSIIADPDTLYLSNQQTATFTTNSDELISWQWYRNDLIVESIANPTLYFPSEGTYEMAVTSTSVRGCRTSKTLTYEVYANHPVALGVDVPLLKPHPNPSSGLFMIPTNGHSRLTISDQAGKMLYQSDIAKDHWIDMSTEKKGIYFIQLSSGSKIVTWKVVLK